MAVCTACWTCLKMHACIIMHIYIYVYTCAFVTCFNIISHTCPDCNKPTQVKVGHDTNTFRCYIGRWIISASTCHRPVQASPALCRHPHADVSRDPAGTRSAKAHDQCCKQGYRVHPWRWDTPTSYRYSIVETDLQIANYMSSRKPNIVLQSVLLEIEASIFFWGVTSMKCVNVLATKQSKWHHVAQVKFGWRRPVEYQYRSILQWDNYVITKIQYIGRFEYMNDNHSTAC